MSHFTFPQGGHWQVLSALCLWFAGGLPAAGGGIQSSQSDIAQAGTPGISQSARPRVQDWVLRNRHLRVLLRSDSLTLSVDELGTSENWGSDPWENSAGRLHFKSRGGQSLAVALGAAAVKRIEPVPAGESSDAIGLRIYLAKFRTRMGPVREDRDVENHVSVVLALRLAKESPELTFRVEELHNTSPYWRFETLEWPLRLFPIRTTDDDGYIVFPEEQGFIIPSRFDGAGYFRYLNWVWERIAGQAQVFDRSSMPWFGAKKGRSSFLCIVETPDDVAYGLIGNDVRAPGQPAAPPSAVPAADTVLHAPRLSAIWPYWNSVKGELGYPRVARYIFQPRGGYVEMCKTYRKHARKTGKFVTLKRKIDANPEVGKLLGAANFEIQVVANRYRAPQFLSLSGPVFDGYHQMQTSFGQVEEIVRDLKENLGVDRALIRIAGWGRRGYDNERPIDIAEANVEAGGPARLASAIQAARKAGYLAGLWDNYRNFDLNSPSYDEKYILRDTTGALVPGFTSESGHSQEICVLEAIKIFQRNMDSARRKFGPNQYFLDTVGGLPLVECHDARHPLTRTGTREARMRLMRVATDAGMVLGVEGPPQDYTLGLAAYYDEHPLRIGIDVPLYALVYHECAALYRQHSNPYNYGMDNYGASRGAWPAKFLRGLLYGDQSSWTVSNRAYYAWRKTFKAINDLLAPLHRRLGQEEMLDHQFLTPDLLVQRTIFSSGVEVTVNYGEFPFRLADQKELPAYGYLVKDSQPGGRSYFGRVETGIMFQN